MSKGTLSEDANVVSQDFAIDSTQPDLEETTTLLSQAWDDWHLDPMDIDPSTEMQDQRGASLASWEVAADAMSAADICFGRAIWHGFPHAIPGALCCSSRYHM